MKTVPISGVIGLDVTAANIRAALTAAKGEDIRVEIASPGGLVFDGLEIFNLLANYKGKVTCHVMGLSASMATYIALAGSRVTAEANAVWMVHNAQGVGVGDQNDLRKTADILDSLSGVLAAAYAKKTGKTFDQVRALMDAETWLFGSEAKDAGFVDEIIGSPAQGAKALALANAKGSFSAFKGKLRDLEPLDAQKVAACIGKPMNSTGAADVWSQTGLTASEIRAFQKAGLTPADVREFGPGSKNWRD